MHKEEKKLAPKHVEETKPAVEVVDKTKPIHVESVDAPKTKAKSGPALMRVNVKHDGVDYAAGSEVPAEHLEYFKKQGFVE